MRLAKQISLLFELYEKETNNDNDKSHIECENLERSLDSKILERYRKAKNAGERGIAILEDGACSNCHNSHDESYAVLGCGWFINTCVFCGSLLVGYEPGN